MTDNREVIISMFQSGKTYQQIANRLGVSRGTVGGHICRWRKEKGLLPERTPGERWNVEQDDQIATLCREGLSHAEIASIIGRTEKAVRTRLAILADCGAIIRTNQPERPPDTLFDVKKMRLADAKLLRAMAEAFQRGDHLPKTQRAA